jgi:hypothetical protein
MNNFEEYGMVTGIEWNGNGVERNRDVVEWNGDKVE